MGDYEQRFLLPDGSIGYYYSTFKGFYDKNDKLVEIKGIVQDITKIKKTENELIKSNLKFKNAFNRANFFKDVLSHDINNIIQSINTGMEINEIYLDMPEKKKILKENFRIIRDQLKRGSNLVNNIRIISKIDQNSRSLHILDILYVLKKSVDHIDVSYSHKNKKIEIQSEFQVVSVYADDLLENVFENLLINAIIHNNSKIIKIIIKVMKIEVNKSIRLEFIDNGKGIEDSRKKEIFNRGNFEKGSVHGMGLGLSLVKKIIKTYNGMIWVENRVNGDYTKGSKFIITVPYEKCVKKY